MMETWLRSLRHELPATKPVEPAVLIVILSILAGLSTIRLAVNLGYNYGVFRSIGGDHSTCCINFLESFLILITMGLYAALLGLLLKRTAGVLLSLLGLFLVVGSYLSWYRGTLSIIRLAEIQRFDQLPHQSQKWIPLAYSNWWDIAVLALILLLIVWQVMRLVRGLRRRIKDTN